jgi:hypothetical protein
MTSSSSVNCKPLAICTTSSHKAIVLPSTILLKMNLRLVPSRVSHRAPLLIYNRVNLPILNSQATGSKPQVFLKPHFSTIIYFSSIPHLSCFCRPQHLFPKGGALPIIIEEQVGRIHLILLLHYLFPQFRGGVVISMDPGSQ